MLHRHEIRKDPSQAQEDALPHETEAPPQSDAEGRENFECRVGLTTQELCDGNGLKKIGLRRFSDPFFFYGCAS